MDEWVADDRDQYAEHGRSLLEPIPKTGRGHAIAQGAFRANLQRPGTDSSVGIISSESIYSRVELCFCLCFLKIFFGCPLTSEAESAW